MSAGKEYTYIVIGKDADDSVQTLAIENPIEAIPAGNVRLQVAHAAPDAGPLDVYLTAPGDLLPAATPIAQVTYGNDPDDRFLKAAGTYVISVTPAGDPDTVLFDSSEVALQAGQDLLLVAVTNTTTATDEVPVSLIVNNRFLTSEIPDKDLPSDLRVVHVSPDAPALNVIGDRETEGAANVPFATGLPYLAYTDYVSAPRDNYIVNGATTAEPDTVIFSFTRSLIAGQRATVLALGLLASINDLVLADDIRSVYAEGKLRIVDAAPGSGTVDVYVLGIRDGHRVGGCHPAQPRIGRCHAPPGTCTGELHGDVHGGRERRRCSRRPRWPPRRVRSTRPSWWTRFGWMKPATASRRPCCCWMIWRARRRALVDGNRIVDFAGPGVDAARQVVEVGVATPAIAFGNGKAAATPVAVKDDRRVWCQAVDDPHAVFIPGAGSRQ